jgi:hypothetical protein
MAAEASHGLTAIWRAFTRADRDHGRRRQYSDTLDDHLRPGASAAITVLKGVARPGRRDHASARRFRRRIFGRIAFVVSNAARCGSVCVIVGAPGDAHTRRYQQLTRLSGGFAMADAAMLVLGGSLGAAVLSARLGDI